MNEEYDLAIVGSGPAGISAATTAAQLGLNAVLYDEQSAPGGQIYRSIERVASENRDVWNILGSSYQHGAKLVSDFHESGAKYEPHTKVWSIENGNELGIVGPAGSRIVKPKRVLIAVGAMERPFPIPGWTLPGVMSAGAAQILIKSSSQVPNIPFVVVGSGPLLFLVTWQLVKCGAPVKAVLETTPIMNYVQAARFLPSSLNEFSSIWQGFKWIRDIRGAGIPITSYVSDVRIEGAEKIQQVRYKTATGRERTLDCEMALLHQGVVPNYQMASLAGCELEWNETQECWQTGKDTWGATSVKSVSVAGDCGGIGGAIVAEHQGRLAGFDAAYRTGRITKQERSEKAEHDLRSLKRLAGIRSFLDGLYKPAPWVSKPKDHDTIVCRCEEVTAGELRSAIKLGCLGPNQAKTMTRCGMGPCQGRLCGSTVSSMIAAEQNQSVSQVGFYRVRPPIKPITVEELSVMDDFSEEEHAD